MNLWYIIVWADDTNPDGHYVPHLVGVFHYANEATAEAAAICWQAEGQGWVDGPKQVTLEK